jgi:hypothetical protein
METRKLAVPLLAFAGGAILGRVLGLKTLMREAMTAAAVTGIASPPVLVGQATHRGANGAHRRKAARRVHRRSPRGKSSTA